MGSHTRPAGIVSVLAIASALAGCTLVDLGELQKGQGGAGGTSSTHATGTGTTGSSSSSTGSSSTSSGQTTSTGTGMQSICTPQQTDKPCGACVRSSCCDALKKCQQSDQCNNGCRNCMLTTNNATDCATECNSNSGMALLQCAFGTCNAACN